MASRDAAEDETLFRFLKGEITFEEWERGRETSEASVALDTPDVLITGVSQGEPPIKTEPPDDEHRSGPVPGNPEQEDDDVVILETETTIKYLRGEIPFSEYQSLMEAEVKVEPPDDIAADIDVVTQENIIDEGAVDEFPLTSTTTTTRKPRVTDRRKSRLPKHLQGLMGEANMKFARGEHDETIKMCMEVIRLAPTAPEPFQTLGLLYEDRGENEKALQFLLIAAHLNPTDSEEWVKLAEMSLDADNVKQAITCYDKAIKYDDRNMQLVWARCDLYERLGDQKKAMEGYQIILKLLPKEDGEHYMQLARDMTKNLHESGESAKAISTMETAFQVHPDFVTAEDVNLILELFMSQGMYDKPIEIVCNHCGVRLYQDKDKVLDALNAETIRAQLKSVHVPSELAIDLRIKLVVCLVHLDCMKAAQLLLLVLYEENPDDMGDLYLDVAEAYMDTGNYIQAEPLLDLLVNSNKYNLAAVWLRYAECLNSLGNIQKAAAAYERVVDMAPNHMSARVSLSLLQQQLGRYDEALNTLQQEPAEGAELSLMDLRLELPRCLLLLSQGKREEFISCCRNVLFHHFLDMFTSQHMAVILANRSQKHRISALKHFMGTRIEQRVKDAANVLVDSTYTVDDLWDLYLKLCDVLVEEEKFEEFLELSIMALMNPIFMMDTNKIPDIEFICLVACLLNKNGHYAYNFIREICVKQLNNNRAWNLFSQIVTLSQDFRHNRFCLRLMLKHPTHLALGLLNGHNALVSGTYKHALGEYVAAFRQDPKNPLISLCIGLTFMHMASQKFAGKRHSLIVQACSFLNQYLELRGDCQESFYNLGRAMHQIGLGHAAVYYYQKALSFPPAVPDQEHIFDLSHEIAFNLCLIYKSSGSHDLAAHVMSKYLVI